ncbi:MAG: hypothetical protein A2802_02615 [Candidatus Woykebacteria bacterium RIFCSPHIGHO2_01_FULL_43_29]|uniref:Glycosyltransferase 2-like domain-containing protein n=2 Tax=Candidatus Woykeibacteriota TaxID=1817899 RepID=A0A1G1WW18_9BACT|nr:MAG: hypothetical protein A2802_02615 [Candidatus Woykebacteria bacterium RIFCSPHIGHO2_01_FULL_43_29]OGY30098.1 MAG: hypothetical protein A3J50_03375 [Candidatus Woykebacteria bacterium RIFCSPHIGHO2_02_FULL_43_16b]OGY31771.1 MAG: hypothetical protein A3A61_02110 [Candidatus Woykebacteria bacterium RIFCSPLOWO2_01_FULL_43_14]
MISVIIPTYKRKDKLRQTLESVLNQSIKDYEVIVVEDGSNDGTKEMVTELRDTHKNLSYFYQTNKGPAAARNQGISKAKGEIIAFTDDDCVVPRDWLERLLAGFKKHPEVVGVGGKLEASEDELKKNVYARYEKYMSLKAYGTGEKEVIGGFDCPAGGTNNLAYKKKVLVEVGGFDETFPVAAGEDADIKKRITDKGYKILYLPLKVEHHQDYYFGGFLKQSYNRGIGSYHFQKKWSQPPTKLEIYKQMLLLAIKSKFNLLVKPQKFFVLLDFIFQWQEYRGMLKHVS